MAAPCRPIVLRKIGARDARVPDPVTPRRSPRIASPPWKENAPPPRKRTSPPGKENAPQPQRKTTENAPTPGKKTSPPGKENRLAAGKTPDPLVGSAVPPGKENGSGKEASPVAGEKASRPGKKTTPADARFGRDDGPPAARALGSPGPGPEKPDRRDWEMSRKVRRSYSRLSAAGPTSPPPGRRSFGFEGPRGLSPVGAEAKAAAPWEPDAHLPGIALVKEKRRRRKVPEILKSELDEWAAAMNAQFEAAEQFDLLVE
ncbi:sororin [Tachyglossus aculeatus]|uniref:sororin n=1 Tax=Tachyglossus aculeatus TaxID=9261 RepID=UPI0018F2B480|nr:sororin [Tachyglossus aculeatus]